MSKKYENKELEKLHKSQNMYMDEDGNIKNDRFVQYYNMSFPFRSQLLEESATAYRVFDLLAKNMENNNTIATSKEEIAQALGKSKETIKRAIKLLKDYNFLCIIRFGKDYIYFLNPEIVFNRQGKYKHQCVENYINHSPFNETQIQMKIEQTKELIEFKNRERVAYKFKLNFDEFNENEATATVKNINVLDKADAHEKQQERAKGEIEDHIKELEKLKAELEYYKKEIQFIKENGRESEFLDNLPTLGDDMSDFF